MRLRKATKINRLYYYNLHRTGKLKLDDSSYVIVVPDYLENNVFHYDEVLNTSRNLKYDIKKHINGSPEARATHYIGPTYKYSDIVHKANQVIDYVPLLKLLKS